jgi:FkbM family methyltransferase
MLPLSMDAVGSKPTCGWLLRAGGYFAKFLPPRLPEIVYTVLLKPGWLRKMTHRILLRLSPSEVTVEGAKLYLNPSDPVLTPSVALGIYENYEQEVFRQFCKPGAVVVDIGANVGLYTAIAATRVGSSGRVISIEPHPESYGLLQRTIHTNGWSWVKAFNLALGDRRRQVDLFLTDENKADSRIYDVTGERGKITVQMTDLDSLLMENQIEVVELLKMDTQGAEAMAFRGMQRTLAKSPEVTIFTEFWPWGIEKTGESAADFLRDLKRVGFTIKEIDEGKRQIIDVADVEQLISKHDSLQYTGSDFRRSHANLICIKTTNSNPWLKPSRSLQISQQ